MSNLSLDNESNQHDTSIYYGSITSHPDHRNALKYSHLLASSSSNAARRHHPSIYHSSYNLRESDVTAISSYLRFSSKSPSIVKASNLPEYIHSIDGFGKAADHTAKLYGGDKLVNDKYATIEEFTDSILDNVYYNSQQHSRTVYPEYVDEVPAMAAVDQILPDDKLLGYIKHIATIKAHNRSTGDKSALYNKFSESALMAIGIIVDELMRDMMIQWRNHQHPLKPTIDSIRIASQLQLQGCVDPLQITTDMLHSRLDILFQPPDDDHHHDGSYEENRSVVDDMLVDMQVKSLDQQVDDAIQQPNDMVMNQENRLSWESFNRDVDYHQAMFDGSIKPSSGKKKQGRKPYKKRKRLRQK